MRKRVLSLCMTLAMCLSLLPPPVLAAQAQEEAGWIAETSPTTADVYATDVNAEEADLVDDSVETEAVSMEAGAEETPDAVTDGMEQETANLLGDYFCIWDTFPDSVTVETGQETGVYPTCVIFPGTGYSVFDSIKSSSTSVATVSGGMYESVRDSSSRTMESAYWIHGVREGRATITLSLSVLTTTGAVLDIGRKSFSVNVIAHSPIHTVSFNANGGSVSQSSITVTEGSTYGGLPTPTRDGYTFDGWYTAASGGTKIIKGSPVSLTSDHTLYAHWTAILTNSVSLSPKSVNIQLGEEQRVIVAASNSNFSYYRRTIGSNNNIIALEWGAEDEKTATSTSLIVTGLNVGTETVKVSLLDSDENELCSDTFTVNVTEPPSGTPDDPPPSAPYTVTFDLNPFLDTDDGIAPRFVSNGETYGTLPTPTHDGYTFDGWYTAKSGGTKITANTVVSLTADQTLYAHWTPVQRYMVTFNANADADTVPVTVSPGSKVVTNGEPYGTLPNPTRMEYVFVGWYTAKSGGEKITESSVVSVTGNQTLYAHWESQPILPDSPQIAIESKTVSPGSTVDVSVLFRNNPGVVAVNLWIGYNSDWLTLTNVSDGGILGTPDHGGDKTQVPYHLYWHNDTSRENFSENGTIATLTFQVRQDAPADNYPITITPDASAGMYNVTLTPYTPDVQNGNIAVSNIVWGDAYRNDGVNALDVTALARYVATGWPGFTEEEINLANADVYHDDVVNAFDVTVLARHIATGWKAYEQLPFIPASLRSASFSSVDSADLMANPAIKANSIQVETGQAGQIQISLENNPGVVAVNLWINYDKERLTLTNVEDGGILGTPDHGGDKTQVPYHLYWHNDTSRENFSENGTIATLTFQVREDAPADNYPITITPDSAAGMYNVDLTPYTPDIQNGNIHVLGNTWRVTFESNGGSAVPAENVPKDTAVAEPTAPTKAGNAFDGWYSDEALTAPWNFATPVTQDMTLYAKWTPNPISVEVTFESNGGSAVPAESVPKDTAVAEPTAPTKAGNAFGGWYSDEALTALWDFATPVTQDMTLYAKWTPNPVNVEVTFESNGGSAVPSATVPKDTAVTEPTAPTKAGNAFGGWYSDEALTTPWHFEAPVTQNMTLYAKWTDNNGGGSGSSSGSSGGCYVATSVYGSYDCPEVWTLRRFRDDVLAQTWYGRLFIRLYYAVSPTAVKLFGDSQWFQNFFRDRLDKMVSGLQADGFESTPYEDRAW